jgi:hypothetical protein
MVYAYWNSLYIQLSGIVVLFSSAAATALAYIHWVSISINHYIVNYLNPLYILQQRTVYYLNREFVQYVSPPAPRLYKFPIKIIHGAKICNALCSILCCHCVYISDRTPKNPWPSTTCTRKNPLFKVFWQRVALSQHVALWLRWIYNEFQ